MSEINLLLTKAGAAVQNAYVPNSNFSVGACIKTLQGHYYTGCNVENACYNLGLCAESSAIAAMVTAGERQISEIMIISSGEDYCYPCGACRQRLLEFALPHLKIHCATAQGAYKTFGIEELLPHSFNNSHLPSA